MLPMESNANARNFAICLGYQEVYNTYIMFNDLEQIVDKKFWSIINDLRIHATKKQRVPFLTELKTKLGRSEYFPGLPVTVKELNKGHGVARQIPIFNLADYSVFYYCVRKLEHVIAKNRVDGTYGGWSMGGKIRKKENAEEPAGEYPLTYSYNPAAWARYYGEYNSYVFAKINELIAAKKQKYIVYEIDIANFYDNIQHPVLENKIRRDGDYQESGVLDLLMYFLGYSNRHVTQYQKRTVGVPQDAFGDCSRLLANYYLQDYDQYMSELAIQHKATYLRYADDQLLFVPDDKTGELLIQLASRRLAQLGLNINQKKVEKRTLAELYTYRSFKINDIFAPKGSYEDKVAVNNFATQSFQAINTNHGEIKNQGYPLIRRLITSNFNLLEPSNRAELMKYVFEKKFVLAGKAYSYQTAYEKMRNEEKKDYLTLTEELVQECRHSDFHYEVLAFYRRVGIDTTTVEDRIAELQANLFEAA